MSKLIIPETPDLFGSKKKISDFEPVSPEELHMNMTMPIEQVLAQGCPPESPTQIPIEAVCRMIATIQQMGSTLAETQKVLEKILVMKDLPLEAKKALDSLFAPQIDLDALGINFDGEAKK